MRNVWSRSIACVKKQLISNSVCSEKKKKQSDVHLSATFSCYSVCAVWHSARVANVCVCVCVCDVCVSQ